MSATFATMAWVSADGMYRHLGDERWLVSWETLKPGADFSEDIDPRRQLMAQSFGYRTRAQAMAAARKLVDNGRTFFGVATVQRQRVEWFVEEDGVGEWTDVGDSEEIS